uniref:Uncharacterized protein n=1 Tax=Curvibacter symbiont subsp. Hydra magnipapillata TaxID=667019 RepID=C9YEK0_CURXX|nr:hypothetical protein Csp_D30060 [Curvibacter putative symbiont of Hydra magnipapillata]
MNNGAFWPLPIISSNHEASLNFYSNRPLAPMEYAQAAINLIA